MNYLCCRLALAFCLAGFWVMAQEQTEQKKPKLTMAEYMALAKPGPEHEILQALVGSWNQTYHFFREDGQPPLEFTGTSVNKLVLGGRFLQANVTGGDGAAHVQGLSLLGFDRRFGHYTLTGCDTMGTSCLTGEGKYDEKTRTLTLSGEDDDPLMGVVQKYDLVFQIVDEDTYTYSIIFKDYRAKDEAGMKAVEVTHVRIKGK